MQLIQNWTPTVGSGSVSGSNATNSSSYSKRQTGGVLAAKLGASVQLHMLYEWAQQNGVIVVGGSSDTVGIGGGYFQGGGHSLQGAVRGNCADNTLEFTIVLANGTIVVANENQYSDLFWAARGGGGGTWGVVLDVTVNAFTDPPVIRYNFNVTYEVDTDEFWEGAAAGLELVGRNVIENGGSGYWYVYPKFIYSANTTVATFQMFTFFINQTDTAQVAAWMDPMAKAVKDATPNAMVPVGEPWLYLESTMTQAYLDIFTGADDDDKFVAIGSRLLNRDFTNSEGVGKKLAATGRALNLTEGSYFNGLLTYGKQTWANADLVDDSVVPYSRQTSTHLLVTRAWDNTFTFAEQQEYLDLITKHDVPSFDALYNDGPAYSYQSESDPNTPNPQERFYGPNYAKLQQIKAIYDPTDFFIVRKGVNSEHWDDDGHCRISGSAPTGYGHNYGHGPSPPSGYRHGGW